MAGSKIGQSAFKKWVPIETLPIFGVVGLAVGGAGYYLWRLSQGPEVVWDRGGDWRPWDKIKQDQNQKFLAINKDFWEKRKTQYADKERVVDNI